MDTMNTIGLAVTRRHRQKQDFLLSRMRQYHKNCHPTPLVFIVSIVVDLHRVAVPHDQYDFSFGCPRARAPPAPKTNPQPSTPKNRG